MRWMLAALVALSALAAPGAQTARAPELSFTLFSHTNVPLGDVAWTGSAFVYTTETLGDVWTSGPKGAPLSHLAMLPHEVEEVRCAPSPGNHGFPAGAVFCHDPRGGIWQIGTDGTTSAFATLPETAPQDGTLAFDTQGGFGYELLAASGGSQTNGGTVYGIRADGSIRKIGAYPGPGGADGIELAPRRFGSASGQLLIGIDKTAAPEHGAVLAMKPDGSVRKLVDLREGINPIVVIGRGEAPRGAAAPGLYLADTISKNVVFLAAKQLRAHVGSVIVGAEKTAHLWIVSPKGTGFRTVRMRSTLDGAKWNLEGGCWVG